MAQENTQGQTPASGMPPGELPVVGEKKFFTHTMQEDVAKSKGDPASFIKEQEAKKPFAQFIPPVSPSQGGPAPMPADETSADKFREAIEDIPHRDQPFPFPEGQTEPPAVPQFQVRIPTGGRALGATTIILTAVLVLLIAGGAAGYWWFFMRTPQSEVVVQIPEQKPAPVPEPIVPQPVPEPVPVPEPTPQPIEEPATTTPATEPVATSTPAAAEPITPPPAPVVQTPAPDAVLALDRTVTITLSQPDKKEALEKIAVENAQITDGTATIRYVFVLPAPTGQHYLSGAETAQLLGLAVPEGLWPLAQRTDLVGYKNAGTMRYGLASAITNKTRVKSAALAWEKTMLDNLASLYMEKAYEKPAHPVFATNTYLSFYKRYLNMPQPDVSLDWAVSNNFFIVATSKDMVYAVLNKAAQVKK